MKKFSITIFILCFAVFTLFSQQNDKMVRIEGGTFIMGSPADEEGRKGYEHYEVQRQATVSSFYISKYEVTQKEYLDLIGMNPSKAKGDDLPVNNVTWFDALRYCNKLSERESLTPVFIITGAGANTIVNWDLNANGYRLPTDKEWEYACRAGTTTAYYTGNTITIDQANFNNKKPKPVGSYPPKPRGLYDMHGNVSEWGLDSLSDVLSKQSIEALGAWNYTPMVVRGGSYSGRLYGSRSASKYYMEANRKFAYIGFRVARNAE